MEGVEASASLSREVPRIKPRRCFFLGSRIYHATGQIPAACRGGCFVANIFPLKRFATSARRPARMATQAETESIGFILATNTATQTASSSPPRLVRKVWQFQRSRIRFKMNCRNSSDSGGAEPAWSQDVYKKSHHFDFHPDTRSRTCAEDNLNDDFFVKPVTAPVARETQPVSAVRWSTGVGLGLGIHTASWTPDGCAKFTSSPRASQKIDAVPKNVT